MPAEKLTLGTLPRNDTAKAIELASKLMKKGELRPEYLSMILQSQDDPEELERLLEDQGIEAS